MGLTAVFGMGTGGSPPLSPPDFRLLIKRHLLRCSCGACSTDFKSRLTSLLVAPGSCHFLNNLFFRVCSPKTAQKVFLLSQALGLLVPVSLIRCRTYTSGLSTLSSLRGLTSFRCERPHLKAGFTLRCFQRLSFPDVATQLYPWRDNWYTIGPSTPVLSY